mmetsp:Transcript_22453/g.62810  ORF Transcript_22453/g.62810 Transcript_22453/m.62810 type:complete len:292 (-) Transcript_22453:84-959(-)|eukprot:CAMPEP_0117559350 /NCGR_PEP_ID=MMETSP0784-20121206/53314_1 /TAXON_ID=39447 /ORGANISM="" /LENGTH=291 /DNA_ID=CAMNT_0005356723 /DNA_START=105 /DNA_END=980 /DNA_ORIENTATION=+
MEQLQELQREFKEAFHDPEKAKRLLVRCMNHRGVRLWGGFTASAIVIFWVCSSGDFSFMLTLSSLVSMFSFLMVLLAVVSCKSVHGVSLKMMECYILVYFCRCCAIIPFEGYLPYDKSGDWFYQLCEVACLCISGAIVYFCRVDYASTYGSSTDNLNHLWLIGPAAAVALILHPHLNGNWPTDVAWAFALYLESVTVLPQLFMFMKEGKAQAHTSHFLAAQALARLLSFVFWASSFSELSNPNHYIKQFVGNWVVVIQLLQLVIMGDFIYHYVRCLQQGIPVSEVLASTNV